ncbi:MAG: ribosomal RNA small subunit methyltransferase A [Xanthomonadaceae bacterium]|nr:ribosomal RNA small subunit methyltransferase A [Rhodospirillaceae bacterium]NIA18121.1 ribosomal RNA small subunit methyltransferase A [Xanthomonadaceae bacterium]
MCLLAKTKLILKKNKIALISRRGQNFLINQKILNKIIKTSDLKLSDIILEIGPGLGVLTKELAKKVKKVIAVEIDKKLVSVLKNELKEFKNVEIIEGNILRINVIASDWKERSNLAKIANNNKIASSVALFPSRNDSDFNYKIVANLPYNIISRVIRNFLESENSPKEMILMVQKEVAERIVAPPGRMSILSVASQFYANCRIISIVKKNNFFPVPKVDSAIIKLKIKSEKGKTNKEKFFKIVKAGFSKKRKKLKNNLSEALKIDKIKIDNTFKKIGLGENIRAQELSVQNWKSLVILLNDYV